MQEGKVIGQQEINIINTNIIEDTKNNSERKIKENLIDAEEHKDSKVEIKTKNNEKKNNNGNIISNNKIQQQKTSKVEIKLSEKKNTNNINKITNSNDINVSQNLKVKCIGLCIIIVASLLYSLILLTLNFSIVLLFLYYRNNCKKCKSELYQKINEILLNYLGLFILRILYILFIIANLLYETNRKCCKVIRCLYFIITSIFETFLYIYNIIIVQKYYNKTTSWESCGKFKGWMIFWLIINYISVFVNFSNACCGYSQSFDI